MPGYPYSRFSPPAHAGNHINLRQMKEVLKKELQSRWCRRIFEAAKLHLPALAHHQTPLSVLAVLGDESSRRYPEKEALTRTLVAEYKARRETLWSGMLLVAYYPVLKKLHMSLRSNVLCADELEQLVIEQFLQVVAEFRLDNIRDRTCMRLRQGTRRAVFQAVREMDQEHGIVESAAEDDLACLECRFIESLGDDDRPGLQTAPWPEAKQKGKPQTDPDELELMVTLLLKRARSIVPRRKLEVVIATFVHGERLRSYVNRRHPRASDTERRRTYERLKRERTRTVDLLRGLLADLR